MLNLFVVVTLFEGKIVSVRFFDNRPDAVADYQATLFDDFIGKAELYTADEWAQDGYFVEV
jgi:hypothetical protein